MTTKIHIWWRGMLCYKMNCFRTWLWFEGRLTVYKSSSRTCNPNRLKWLLTVYFDGFWKPLTLISRQCIDHGIVIIDILLYFLYCIPSFQGWVWNLKNKYIFLFYATFVLNNLTNFTYASEAIKMHLVVISAAINAIFKNKVILLRTR